jgi:hypothetical protein
MIALVSLLLLALALTIAPTLAADVYVSGIMGNGSAVLAYVYQSQAQPIFVAPYNSSSPPQVAVTPDGELMVFVYNKMFQPFNLSAPLPFSPTNSGTTPFPCVEVGLAFEAFTCVSADGRAALVYVSDVVDLIQQGTPLTWKAEPSYAVGKKVPSPRCLLFDGDSGDEWWHVVSLDPQTGADQLEMQFANSVAFNGAVPLKAVLGPLSGATTVRACINFHDDPLFGLVVDSPRGFLIVRVQANKLPLAPNALRTDRKTLAWSAPQPTTLQPDLFASVNAPNGDILMVTRDSTAPGQSTVWIFDGFGLFQTAKFVVPFVVTDAS